MRKPVSSAEAIGGDRREHGDTGARRIHSLTPRGRFIAVNTRPPTSSARPATSQLPPHTRAAGAWCARSRLQGRTGQDQAKDRTGAGRPQQAGGDAEQQRRGTLDREAASPCPRIATGDRRAPRPVASAVRQVEGKSRVSPKTASSTMAARRPYWFALTAQPPRPRPVSRSAAKVTAIPASSGSPLRENGRSARAKTKGSTGRMHGLTMVRTPAR